MIHIYTFEAMYDDSYSRGRLWTLSVFYIYRIFTI